VHHPRLHRCGLQQFWLPLMLVVFAVGEPGLAMAQASPFMTGATSLQTKGRTLLAAASRVQEAFPCAQVRAFALVRTLGLIFGIKQLLDPCKGEIRWRSGDAQRRP
jgi:hypothetical protein